MTDSGSILVSVKRAGEMIGASRPTVYKLMKSGALRAVRSGGRTLVETEALREYAESLPAFRTSDENRDVSGSQSSPGRPETGTEAPYTAAKVAVSAAPAGGPISPTSRLGGHRIILLGPAEFVGEWETDCRIGRDYGREVVDHIRKTKDHTVLPAAVRAITDRGTCGGVEVGFFAFLSMILAETA